MNIMKLNEWKCDMNIDDVDIEPIGALKDMIDHFGLKYNPRTGSYDCDGDVNLYNYYYALSATEQMAFNAAFVMNGRMTIRFGEVKGRFALPGDYDKPYILTSLKGSPQTVGYGFYCSHNKLTSLEGCPKSVGGDFYCNDNQLTTLEGCPESVGGNFYCHHNKLTSLKGCPKSVGNDFSCNHNRLTSLKGCPKTVDGCFYCRKNRLTSLKYCPETVGGDFNCNHNRLTSLEGCPKIVGGYFSCRYNKAQFTKKDVTAVCNVKRSIYA